MEKADKITALADEISKYSSFTKENIKEKYLDIAEKYDEVAVTVEYPDPKK